RLGATVVNLPGGEIVPALRSGAIDASEWVGPWNDMYLGLHKASKFYYYPGFHEPGTVLSTAINKARWDSLTAEERGLIITVASAEYTYSLAEFNANNAKSLQELREDKSIEIRKFDDSILKALGEHSGEVMAEVGAKDPLTRRTYQSYMEFRNRYTPSGSLGLITQRRIPVVVQSQELSRHAERITAAAPALLTVASQTEKDQWAHGISIEVDTLNELLSQLRQGGVESAALHSLESGVEKL